MRAVLAKVFELGEGDVAVGAVRAFEAGVLDVPRRSGEREYRDRHEGQGRGDVGAMLQNGTLLWDVPVRRLLTLMRGLYVHPLPLDEVIERVAEIRKPEPKE